jgi:N-acetylmuramoyl-L-alanine amidase
MSMFQNAYLDKSISFAAEVESQFATNKQSKSRGVKQAGFAVLRRAAMPAVLVEAGFLSNADEEQYLMSEEGQANIVNALLKAFDNFYQKEKHQKSSESKGIVDAKQTQHLEKSNSKQPMTVTNSTTSSNPSIKSGKESPSSTISSTFRVQIAATKGEVIDMDSPAIRKVGKLEIINVNDLNKYLVGSFKTREEAVDAKEKLVSFGYQGAFIVAF